VKKPLKVALGVSGAILALCGAAWQDAIRRAERSISERERRIPEEIARARAHSRCEALLGKSPPPAVFEKDRESRWDGLWDDWTRHPAPARFEEEMFVELARTQEAGRESGVRGWSAYLHAENTVLWSWKSSLRGQDRSTLRRRFEALEALYAARPPLEEFVSSEKILQEIDLLRVLRRKADPAVIVDRPPCWRELFSWRIQIAKSLAHVEDLARETRALHRSPAGGGHPEWEALFDGDLHYGVGASLHWKDQAAYEAAELTLWSLARAATAVALFRLERGREPGSLSELVPLYLREIPVTRPSGNRVEFQDGFVGAGESRDAGSDPWWPLDR